MTLDEIDSFFTKDLGLLADPGERGSGKTYFWRKVAWEPSNSTRISRVRWNPAGEVISVQLCVSSDNNNSVLVRSPFDKDGLRALIMSEIATLEVKVKKPAPSTQKGTR